MVIGRFSVIRCREAGIHCGIVMEVSGRAVMLKEASRIYKWTEHFTLHEVSIRGAGAGGQISVAVDVILLLEACEVIPCTQEAELDLRNSRNPA